MDSASASPASPKWVRSASVSGSSAAAQRRCPASTAGLPGLLTAASAGRASSSSGWFARYWSSWSSPATSIPSPSPRRPARPHCCRSDAIPPGKPTLIAQSSRPMSTPSSSALVATTPSRRPSVSPRLDLAALLGGVSGAVGRDPRRQLGRVQQQALAGVAVHQLTGLARLREHDRAQPARDQPHHQRRGLAQRAGTDAQLGVQQRRVPDAHVALGRRRSILVDHRQLAAGQHRTRLRRVGDGGRCQQEPRLGAVGGGDPAQACQHVRHVRAEHAPVGVRLVHHHVAQVGDGVRPARVAGQDADVQHVRVGQDQVRPSSRLAPLPGRRVAVVDGRPRAGCMQLSEGASLVLRQRLGRVQVERPGRAGRARSRPAPAG